MIGVIDFVQSLPRFFSLEFQGERQPYRFKGISRMKIADVTAVVDKTG